MTAPPPFLTSPLLGRAAGVRHAFFTRRGGVSTGLYASLNLGRGSRDDPAAVAENRRRAAAAFDAPARALCVCWQTHSARVITLDAPLGDDRPQADGVVTGHAGIVCGALAADCAPVLLADGEARVVAAVHAGWRGALAGVAEAAVVAMTGLGARPERLLAAVGPCIGPDSYEVRQEFQGRFEAEDPGAHRFFRPGSASGAADPEKRLFDLPAYVLARLARAGVERAEWIGADTFAGEARFFSNRRAYHRGEADYGRLLSAIALTA